jgi:hypothetical protein
MPKCCFSDARYDSRKLLRVNGPLTKRLDLPWTSSKREVEIALLSLFFDRIPRTTLPEPRAIVEEVLPKLNRWVDLKRVC